MHDLKRRPVAAVIPQLQDKLYVNRDQMILGIESEKKKKLLYTWNEIPDWQKDNEHILGGYVRETNSFRSCLQSLLYLHNESINIYTHFLPGICFLGTCIFDKMTIRQFYTTTWKDYMVIDTFFIGAFTCLLLSSVFHCFKSHSSRVASLGNKLDYLGIVILIMCSMVSILFYGFYDSNKLFYTFSFITLCFGLSCGTVSLDENFRTREWRPYRAGLFVGFGLSAILPIIGGLMNYGFHETWTRIQLKLVIWEGILYVLGAFLYGLRFPERLAPGIFDFFGHSHQIFHILVVIAALCHLKALLGSYEVAHRSLYRISI